MKRLLLWPVAAAVLLTSSAIAIACGGGGGGLKAHEAALLTDFLIYAIKPEGDDKDYKLVEIGDTKVNAGLLGVVVNTLPLGFLGLGTDERPYDEAAEIAQCQRACDRNRQCKSFDYIGPSAKSPVGMCHLKTRRENFGVMRPVGARGPRVGTTIEPPERETPVEARTPPGRIVFEDSETFRAVRYSEDETRTTPLILKFIHPVSNVKLMLRAGEGASERTRANVEARDGRGRVVDRSGAWISGGEYSFGSGVTVSSGESDRIATVRIDARNGASVLVESVEFVRVLTTPPAHPEGPVIAEAEPTPYPVDTAPPEETAPPYESAPPLETLPPRETPPVRETPPPHERVPPPPRLPPITVEYVPLPPRPVPTAPPTPITEPIVVAERQPEPVALPPQPEPAATAPIPEAAPPLQPIEPAPTPVEDLVPKITNPVAVVPALPVEKPRRQLPIWVAFGAVAFLFGGAGVYWRSHRQRTLLRLTTRLVSPGFDRQTVNVETSSAPDIGLRFVVRSAATVGAPGTTIELVPSGA